MNVRRTAPPALVLALGGFVSASLFAQEAPRPKPLPEAGGGLIGSFATADECARCHSNAPQAKGLRDAKGRGIAPYDLWQSSMMANSTRDPLWRAVVSVEMAATPSKAAFIQAKCLRCHAPMASTEARFQDKPPLGLDVLRSGSELGQLALDGVSCTACHQIQPDDLGTPASYGGHYVIKEGKIIFGPHAEPLGMPMQRFTGYEPKQAEHVRKSALCASCHTLFTDAVDPKGKPTGQRLPEQTPYLEWRNSVFNDEGPTPGAGARSCQGCHAPISDVDGQEIKTRIARNPRGGDFIMDPRSPFGRHVFVGGNTFMLSILRDNAETLRPRAPREAFDRSIALATEQLQTRTAQLRIGEVRREGETLEVPVRVTNLTGHKFPTGHPTRRAWLRVRVQDAAGKIVWSSGEHDERGRLVAPDGHLLPPEKLGGGSHPHRTAVTQPNQVQVYESVMADAEGAPTYLLMRGGTYRKDNRLLPRGWKPDHPDAPATLPRGTADDADFEAGSDALVYRAQAPAEGALSVEVTLLYQIFGARYAAEVFAYDTPQVRELRGYYERADKTPVAVAQATLQVSNSR